MVDVVSSIPEAEALPSESWLKLHRCLDQRDMDIKASQDELIMLERLAKQIHLSERPLMSDELQSVIASAGDQTLRSSLGPPSPHPRSVQQQYTQRTVPPLTGPP